VLVRYRITNGGDAALILRPSGVLVRADGRPVPYGMARDSVDRGRPDVLPRGATETGVIDAAAPAARQVQVILSFAAVPGQDQPAAAPAAVTVPVVFQATFSGVDRLSVSPGP